MDCERTRTIFEELTTSDRASWGILEAEDHLSGCPACQEWRSQELAVASALEMLDTLPVPPDFSERVLDQLPDAVPAARSARAPVEEPRRNRLADFGHSFKMSLERPLYRRRLVPALALVALLILVLGFLAGWQGEGMSVTPGTAIGPLWITGGLVLVAVLVALGLILRPRE